MLNKTKVFILTIAILLGLINIILVYIYDSQINKFMNSGYYQELKTFTRLKYLLGDSINSLQLIVFFFDIFYLLVYYVLNNQRILSYFNLDLESIPQQNSSEYSNFLLEMFFTSLIKLLSLIMSVIFSSQTIIELNKILGNADFANINKEGVDILTFGKNSIIVLITFNAFNMLVYIITYGIRLYEIGQTALKKEKQRTEVLYDLLQNNSRASLEPFNQ